MSIKLIRNVKIILDYWITPTDLGMITKPSSLPVYTGRAPLTACSGSTAGELHQHTPPENLVYNFVSVCHQYLSCRSNNKDSWTWYRERWINADHLYLNLPPLGISKNRIPRKGLKNEAKSSEPELRQHFRNRFPVLWDHFQGLKTQDLKDKDKLGHCLLSLLCLFEKANQLQQSRNNYDIALKTLSVIKVECFH